MGQAAGDGEHRDACDQYREGRAEPLRADPAGYLGSGERAECGRGREGGDQGPVERDERMPGPGGQGGGAVDREVVAWCGSWRRR